MDQEIFSIEDQNHGLKVEQMVLMCDNLLFKEDRQLAVKLVC